MNFTNITSIIGTVVDAFTFTIRCCGGFRNLTKDLVSEFRAFTLFLQKHLGHHADITRFVALCDVLLDDSVPVKEDTYESD